MARPSADADAERRNQTDAQTAIPDVAAPRRAPLAKKGLLAVVLLASSLVAVSAMAIHRLSNSLSRAGTEDRTTSSERPAAASVEPRKLDLAGTASKTHATVQAIGPEHASAADKTVARAHSIPALVPTEDELAEPIGVRRTGSAPSIGPGGGTAGKPLPSEDAPVMLVSTKPTLGTPVHSSPRAFDMKGATDLSEQEGWPADALDSTTRNLQDYQRRLQGLLDDLTRTSDLARGPSSRAETQGNPPSFAPLPSNPRTDTPQGAGQVRVSQLLGGHLPRSSTPTATASMLDKRSLILPKGTAFSCALKSRIVTANSGLVGCMVQRNVYGDDGRVLLIERGSHLDGEYRVTAVRPGMVRIPVLWTRVRTPHGVVVDLDSPAVGQLGDAGIEGHVDNRWLDRIGAAMLLSLIDDSVKLIASEQSEASQGGTVVLSSTTSGTSKLAEKVLDSTINIPPLIYQNQGGIVGIYVARDLDFSGVYELVPTRADPLGP